MQLKEKLFGSLSSCLDCEVSVMSERRSSSNSTRCRAGVCLMKERLERVIAGGDALRLQQITDDRCVCEAVQSAVRSDDEALTFLTLMAHITRSCDV